VSSSFRLALMCRHVFVMLLFFLSVKTIYAQPIFTIENNRKRVTIPFRLVRNMVIVKLEINGKGPYNFVMDTGVGLMIITEPKLIDSLNINSKHLIKIAGLGIGEDIEAYVTAELKVTLPGIQSNSMSAAIFTKDHFGLSNFAGMPIHGLLGYEFFSSFAVKINFEDSTLTVGSPQNIRIFKRAEKLPLSIEENKPYINARLLLANGKPMNGKLIVDLGAGHPVSLEHLLDVNDGLPDKFIAANLGMGITGPISGYLSRIEEVNLGKYKLKNVLVSFPDFNEIKDRELSVKRDGSMGIEILKKFNVIFDYPNGALYLKPNIYFMRPFEHDMCGLEYFTEGSDFKHVVINRVERGSAADEIGLEKGDEIVAINFKSVQDMTIADIDDLFKSRDERSLLIEIFRNKQYSRTILRLKRRI
jgi:hypothetical protein